MVSLIASFVLSFFQLVVLDDIWDLIESVSEGFLTYSFITTFLLFSFLNIRCMTANSERHLEFFVTAR